MAYGVKMVFPSEGFDARSTLEALDRERCNAIHGVPTMFQTMLDDSEFARFDYPRCERESWLERRAQHRSCVASCTKCTVMR